MQRQPVRLSRLPRFVRSFGTALSRPYSIKRKHLSEQPKHKEHRKQPLIYVSGTQATSTDRVAVHYRGTLIDGTVFDESTEVAAEFGLNQVIPGWTEGLQLMSAGDEFRFYLHPSLAYGAGSVGSIPPNSMLIFEVELLEIK